MIQHPCYDEATKTDCPGRHAGCAVDCPAWKAYVSARNAEYERKQAESEADKLLIEGVIRRRNDYFKQDTKSRRRRRRY